VAPMAGEAKSSRAKAAKRMALLLDGLYPDLMWRAWDYRSLS
jgi:hypothetical protein